MEKSVAFGVAIDDPIFYPSFGGQNSGAVVKSGGLGSFLDTSSKSTEMICLAPVKELPVS